MIYSLKTKTYIFAILVYLLAIAPQCLAQNYYPTQSSASIVPGTTDTGNHCDDCVTAVTLPFTYQLYSTSFTTANVSSNGIIQFVGTSTAYNNTALPVAGFSSTIFAYWDDLWTQDTANGQGIFTSVSGSAPNRIFNIEWRTRPYTSQAGVPNNNFEVRLYEGQQKYDIIYGNPVLDGSSATTGVQKDATTYTQFSFNAAGSISSGLQRATLLGLRQQAFPFREEYSRPVTEVCVTLW